MSNLHLLPSAGAAEPDLRSVPQLLRNIAAAIERGEYGIKEAQAAFGDDVLCRGALVLRISGREPQVFGLGDTQVAQTHMDFCAGAAQLMSMHSPGRY